MGNYSYFYMPFVQDRVSTYETYLDVRKIPLYNRISPTGKALPPSMKEGAETTSSSSETTSNAAQATKTSSEATPTTASQTKEQKEAFSSTSVFRRQKVKISAKKAPRIFTVEVSDSYRFWTQNLYYPGGIFDLYIY